MRHKARSLLTIMLGVALFSSLAAAGDPPDAPPADAPHVAERDGKRSHLILAGIVAAAFLVMGAVAGRAKGGPASRRSLRPSGRGPLQKP